MVKIARGVHFFPREAPNSSRKPFDANSRAPSAFWKWDCISTDALKSPLCPWGAGLIGNSDVNASNGR